MVYQNTWLERARFESAGNIRNPKNCESCGTRYYVHVRDLHRSHFCSRRCQQDARREEITKACLQCGCRFIAKLHTGKQWPIHTRARYCSRECFGRARRVERIGRTCLQCGTEFRLTPGNIVASKGGGKFCSWKCKLSWQQREDRPWGIDPKGYLQRRENGVLLKQHRVVMEGILGRKLRPKENVHHRNGKRDDNRPENLELWIQSTQPSGQRIQDKLIDAARFIAQYSSDMRRLGMS